jgi:hypothetical protein
MKFVVNRPFSDPATAADSYEDEAYRLWAIKPQGKVNPPAEGSD